MLETINTNNGSLNAQRNRTAMNPNLLSYYQAIEKASADMLTAARLGNWDEVVKLEGACVLLILQLRQAARDAGLAPDDLPVKAGIVQRILANDAEIRTLTEPWLDDLDKLMAGSPKTLH